MPGIDGEISPLQACDRQVDFWRRVVAFVRLAGNE